MNKRRSPWYTLLLSFIILGLILAGCAEDEPAPTAEPNPTAAVEEPTPAETEPAEAPAGSEDLPAAEPEEPPVTYDNLHVPSPEWQDQIIYFLMTDREGAALEFRITRGSFANAEKLDPDDRFANHVYETPAGAGAETVEIVVEGWWDQ